MEIRSNAIEAPDSDFPCMDPMSVDYDYHETYERQEMVFHSELFVIFV